MFDAGRRRRDGPRCAQVPTPVHPPPVGPSGQKATRRRHFTHSVCMQGGTLRCSSCAKTAARARWTGLASGRCAFNADGAHWVWRREPHQVIERDGIVTCQRCGGVVPSHRRGTFEGRTCPAWRAVAPEPNGAGAADGQGDTDWGAWILRLLGHSTAGGKHLFAGGAAPTVATRQLPDLRDPRGPGLQALFAGGAWRPHVAAQGSRLAACLSCVAFACDWAALRATPCQGWRNLLPPRIAALVTLGDDITRAGGPPVGFADALAARRGERPRPSE
jgi:hypothetical protein